MMIANEQEAEFERQVNAAVSAQLRILANDVENNLAEYHPLAPPWTYAYAAQRLRDNADHLDIHANVVGIVTEWRVAFPSGEFRYYEDNQFPGDVESGETQCRETVLLSDWRMWDED